LIETCDACLLSVYIDAVVDGRLDRLVISGNPSREQMEAARDKIVMEFSELTESEETKSMHEAARHYHLQRIVLLKLETSLKLFLAGDFKASVEYLNGAGIECSIPETEEQAESLAKRIRLRISNQSAKLKRAAATYRDYTSGMKSGGKPTRRYFNRLTVMLSTCEAIKMHLNPNRITVAQFAEYLNIYREYSDYLMKIKTDRKG
jgi:hypothetical protein